MAQNSIELVALAVSLDTTKFRKEMEYTQRLLNQSKGAFRDLSAVVAILDDKLERQLITEQAATAAKNKATLAVERQQEALRKEAEAVKALTLAKEKEAAANLARSQNFLGIGVGSSNTSAVVAKPIPESTRSSLDSYYNSAQAAATATKVLSDEAEKSRQAAIKSQEAFAGWENGLRRATAQLKESRDGAEAWAKGLERVAVAARAAASAAGQLERDARRGSRASFNNALDDILAGNAARDAALQERRTEGLRYLQQFETVQQRVNRQLQEARSYLTAGAITQTEYANATRAISRQNSVLYQGFGQLRGVVSTLLGPLVLAVSAFEALKRAIQLTAELEQARARFKVFLGSVSAANALLRDLRDLSSSAPVSFAGSQRAISTMLQFGVATDQAYTALRQIAEITGGDTQRMEALALSFSQSAAAGRLLGQELLQSVNAGFNPLKIISEQTGESLVELKKRMEEGGVSFEEVTKAYRDATREGGKFNGLLEEISQTTSGKLTRAKSELEKFGLAFGELIKPALDGSLDRFIDDIDRIRQTLEGIAALRDRLSGGLGFLGSGGATTNPFSSYLITLAQAPSIIKDAYKVSFGSDTGLRKFTLEAKDSAEALIRLSRSRISGGISESSIAQARKFVDEFNRLKDLSERIKLGETVNISDADRAKLEEFNKSYEDSRRRAAKITEEEFYTLRKQADEQQKLAKSVEEARKIEIGLIDQAGSNSGKFFTDEQIAQAEKWRAEIEAARLAADELKRVTGDFADAMEKAQESLLDARYGDQAERVGLLLKQSVESERILLQRLIDKGAAYDKILATANKTAQAEAAKLATIQAETKMLEDRAKEQEKRAEQDAAFKEELKNLDSQAKYLREIVTLGKEQARIEQLMRDDGLNQVEAELRQAAEARLAAEEKIAELRKQAKDLTTNTTAFDKLVNSLSELQQLSQLGLIKDSVFNREQANLFNSQAKQTDASAPRAIQAGSSEAFALQANAQAKLISEQIRLADRAFLVQKAIAEASKKTAKVLDEVKDNLGALPTP